MTTLPVMKGRVDDHNVFGTHIVIVWGPDREVVNLYSLDGLKIWHRGNPRARIHVIRYWRYDVSGQVGTFTYNGVVATDDGWQLSMTVERASDAMHVFRAALAEREAHLNRLDNAAARVKTWRPERVRGVVKREGVGEPFLLAVA